MKISKSEIFRYLGYKNHDYDKETEMLVDDVMKKLLSVITPKSLYREYSLGISDDNITIGGQNGMIICSRSLKKNLNGCTGVILFAATLGPEADALIRRYQLISVARAVVAQAVSTELIEAYCNETVNALKAEKLMDGYCLRPRFSAGYGDFKLSHQRDFFRMLDITKKLGIYLNDECLMNPTKSVTAVIGFGSNTDNDVKTNCSICSKKDCEFRNEF
jgi:hypothetical protein